MTTNDHQDRDAMIDALAALPTGSELAFDTPRDFAPGADRCGIAKEYRITGVKKLSEDRWDAYGVYVEGTDVRATFGLLSRHLVDLGVTADDFTAPDAADEDEDGKTTIGSVYVRVIPDTDGFAEAVAKVAGEAADAIDAAGFHLDEFQRERVAALEQAVRVLESRRAPEPGAGAGVIAALVAPGTSVPMIGVQDMVDVAAFIADGDTGRTEVQA